jgi:hypothetical protein
MLLLLCWWHALRGMAGREARPLGRPLLRRGPALGLLAWDHHAPASRSRLAADLRMWSGGFVSRGAGLLCRPPDQSKAISQSINRIDPTTTTTTTITHFLPPTHTFGLCPPPQTTTQRGPICPTAKPPPPSRPWRASSCGAAAYWPSYSRRRRRSSRHCAATAPASLRGLSTGSCRPARCVGVGVVRSEIWGEDGLGERGGRWVQSIDRSITDRGCARVRVWGACKFTHLPTLTLPPPPHPLSCI